MRFVSICMLCALLTAAGCRSSGVFVTADNGSVVTISGATEASQDAAKSTDLKTDVTAPLK